MKTLRVGIIGCGDIAEYHAGLLTGKRMRVQGGSPIKKLLRQGKTLAKKLLKKGAQPTQQIHDIEIIAGCETRADRLEEFANSYGIPRRFTDYKKMLDQCTDLDAILICTPPDSHLAITEYAASKGKHIFCEKPMAMTSDECQKMVDAAKNAGVILQVGYVLRFSDERGRIREAILGDELGRPVFWREIFNVRGGPPPQWVLDAKMGGGPFYENSHILDFFRYTFGDPETIAAISARVKPNHTTAEDCMGVLLTFKDGDRALFTDSYAFRGFGFDKAGVRRNQCQIDVVGGNGWAQYPDEFLDQTLTINRYGKTEDEEERTEQPWSSDWGANGYVEQLEHFFDCVRTGKPTRVPGEEGKRTIELVETVLKAAKSAKVLNFANPGGNGQGTSKEKKPTRASPLLGA